MTNIFKMSNAGGFKTLNRYADMLAGNPMWNPWEPAGAFESIAAVTVPSGGVASITFSSIPQNYAHLQVRFSLRTTADGMPLIANFNADTTNIYTRHHLLGQGSVTNAGGLANQNTANFYGYSVGTSATNPTVGVIDLLDYTNVSKFKTMRTLAGMDSNGSGEIVLSSNLFRSTSSITSIEIASGGTLAQYSSFALYGIKG